MDKEALIKHLVDKFLEWRLPEDFRPDAGITFTPEYNVEYMAKQGLPPMRHEPVGTNLFTADQVEKMFRELLGNYSYPQSDLVTLLSDGIYPTVMSLTKRGEDSLLPLYQAFEKVRAARITDIILPYGEIPILIFDEIDGKEMVTQEWFDKHQPREGGYFVRYAGGYQSYSPAKVFEKSYIKLSQPLPEPPKGDNDNG